MANLYNPTSLYVTSTIVIGLGGSGVEIMRRVKARTRQSIEPPPSIIEYLGLDTEPRPNPPGVERISERDFGYLGNYNASDVLRRLNIHPHIADWWFDDKDIVSGSIHKGARQRRPVGRLSLYVNWGNFAKPFDRKARHIREIIRKEAEQRRKLNVERDSGLVKVYLVGSVCGGTGSGILLDVAFRVREEFKDEAAITGVFLLPSCFLPEIQSWRQRQRVQGNAYAALREINYFMLGNPFHAAFPEQPYYDGEGNKQVTMLNRPFDMLYLVDRSNGKEYLSSLDSLYSMVSQQIFLEVISPVGERLDARRANLQDLAGETSEVKTTTNQQPLIVSSFATASLVLPVDKLLQAASDFYGSDFIQRRLIGRELSSQEIALIIAPRFRALEQAFLFETPTIAGSHPQTGDTQRRSSVRERLLGSSPSSGSGRQIDLSMTYSQVEQALSDIQKDLDVDYQSYGLQGARQLVSALNSRIHKHLEIIKQNKKILTESLDEKEKRLKIAPKSSGPVIRFVDWLVGLFSSSATPSQIRHRNWETQQVAIKKEVAENQQKLDREEQSGAAFTHIQNVLRKISVDIEARSQALGGLYEKLRRRADIPINISRGGGRARVSQDATDVFELATEVGWESYSGVQDEVEFNEPYLHLHPRSIVENNTRVRELEQEMLTRFSSILLSSELTTRIDGNKDLVFKPLPERAIVQIEIYLREQFEGMSNRANSEKDISIINYLSWFYRHVHYREATSRYSPIDPLQMLRKRCAFPFLETDSSRLGSERAFDTEYVKLLGIAESSENNPEVEDILADFDDFEEVITGVQYRTDISVSQHGYPLRILRDLEKFRKNYCHFTESLNEKLHLHREWPKDMPDLVTDVDNEIGVAINITRSSSPPDEATTEISLLGNVHRIDPRPANQED